MTVHNDIAMHLFFILMIISAFYAKYEWNKRD